MIINWFLEIWKWKLITSTFSDLTWSQCTKSVLSGITFSYFLPNRTGDFIGRLFWLKNSHKWQGIIGNFYASIAQLTACMFFGILAILLYPELFWFFKISSLSYSELWYKVIFLIILILSLLIYSFLPVILSKIQFHSSTRILRLLKENLTLVTEFNQIKFKILLLSFLRFFVYSIQFFLILWALNLKLPFVFGFFSISFMYFVLTIVPTFALSEFPTRATISILIFSSTFSSLTGPEKIALFMVFSSFLIWTINLFLPSLIGVYYLPQINHHKTNS